MDEKVIQAGMFDQKSTGTERQQFLQTILHQDEGEEEVCISLPWKYFPKTILFIFGLVNKNISILLNQECISTF